MLALRKRFLANDPAARATLRRFDGARRNLDVLDASLYRFVPEQREKCAGSGRENLAIQPGLLGDVAPWLFNRSFRAARHVRNGQRFGGDQVRGCNDFRGLLMQEVTSAIGGSAMDRRNNSFGLAAIV